MKAAWVGIQTCPSRRIITSQNRISVLVACNEKNSPQSQHRFAGGSLPRVLSTRSFTTLSLLALAICVTGSNVLEAQAASHTNAFTGVWKLDPSRSKYAVGQGPKSATITFARDGSLTYQMRQYDGQTLTWSHPWSIGKEDPGK